MNDDELTRRLRDAVPEHRATFWEDLEQRLADAPADAPGTGGGTVELDVVRDAPRRTARRPARPLLVVLGAAAAVVAVVGAGALLTGEAPTEALPAVPTLTSPPPTPDAPPTSRSASPSATPTTERPTTSAPAPSSSRPATGTRSATTAPTGTGTGTPTQPRATASTPGAPQVTTTLTLTSGAGERAVSVDAVTRGRAPLTIDGATVELNTGPEAWLMGTVVDFGDGGTDGSDPGSATCAADTPLTDVDRRSELSHTYAAAGTYTITYTVRSCRADQSGSTTDSTATLRVTVR